MKPQSDLLYHLDDKPPFFKALFSAFVHLMAMIVAVITPALLICKGIGVSDEDTTRIICMSLVASGIGSLLQIRTFGFIGSGLLSIQGTSFNFVSPLILGGLALKNNGISESEILGILFGTLMFCALSEILIASFLPFFRKLISPLVSGIVVLIIGLSLINVGLISAGGGFGAKANGSFGGLEHLSLAGIVIGCIVFFSLFKNAYIKISALFLSVLIGVAFVVICRDFSFALDTSLPSLIIPYPFYFGFGIDISLILPLILIYAVTSLETIGDITATCEVSGEKIEGEKYIKRLKGGIFANGINSVFSSIICTFPNSCFSQNNGVIALTGVASRYVGLFVGGLLILLGSFPIVANLALQIPEPILGGATLVMFGSIAATGVKILSKDLLDSRSILIIAISLGVGLGISYNPDILQFMPNWIKSLFSSGVASGGLCAIILNLIFKEKSKMV